MGAERIGFVSSGFVFSWLSISGFGKMRKWIQTVINNRRTFE